MTVLRAPLSPRVTNRLVNSCSEMPMLSMELSEDGGRAKGGMEMGLPMGFPVRVKAAWVDWRQKRGGQIGHVNSVEEEGHPFRSSE